jgi:hypothetical protein
MKRTIIIVAMLASSTAIAGTELIPDPKTLDELANHKHLVDRYGTVGYPLADEVVLDRECAEITAVDLGFAPYEQHLGSTPYAVGLGATLAIVSDAYQLGGSMAIAPTVEMFGNPAYTPLGFTAHAYTASDGTSSIEVKLIARGYIVVAHDVHAASALAHTRSLGYQLPPIVEQVSAADLGMVFGGNTWDGRAPITEYVGGILDLRASGSGVEIRALLSTTSFADVEVIGGYYWIRYDAWKELLRLSGHLDIIRSLYGGRIQVLPRSDGTWAGDLAGSVSVTDAMGFDLTHLSVEADPPPVVVIALDPLDYVKDVETGCKLEPKLKSKP